MEGGDMAQCSWQFTPRTGTLRGVDICTLTGRACLINDYKLRSTCTRAAQIRAFLAKHPKGAEIMPREPSRQQAELLF